MKNEACGHCGVWHQGQCTRIKAIEYYPDGKIKRIEYYQYINLPTPIHPAPKQQPWINDEIPPYCNGGVIMTMPPDDYQIFNLIACT